MINDMTEAHKAHLAKLDAIGAAFAANPDLARLADAMAGAAGEIRAEKAAAEQDAPLFAGSFSVTVDGRHNSKMNVETLHSDFSLLTATNGRSAASVCVVGMTRNDLRTLRNVIDQALFTMEKQDEQLAYEAEMRASGYHQCPDKVWRRTPSNGTFDGLCGVCEGYESYDAQGDDAGEAGVP